MRKIYPYLEESYYPNLNEEYEKQQFLYSLNKIINQKQYVKITLLNWEEDPIKEIDGIISSGSISKDGNSSVRRSCSLSCSVDGGVYNIDNIEMDFSLNKKIFIEIGIKNTTNKYLEYPILWFPQGVFYINSFSVNSSTSSAVNLNLSLKDKMCLLNGDIAGELPSTVQFDTMTTQLADGSISEQKVLYYNIIIELLNHWGNEDLNNIIIQDVPLRIRKIVQWWGDSPIYLKQGGFDNIENDDIDTASYSISIDVPEDKENWSEYSKGDDIGYVYSDFVPVEEIVGTAGNTICSILNTIKSQLGNYEYFYDVFGIFHFREIKNYLNETQASTILQESSNMGRHVNLNEGQFLLDGGSETQYLIETTIPKTVYSFNSNENLTSISITPNYNNIKNDFIIDGIKQSTQSNSQYSLRYRCVIDEKPEILGIDENNRPYYGVFDNLIYYTYPEEYNGEIIAETNKIGCFYEFWNESENGSYLSLPNIGVTDQIYRLEENNFSTFWRWNGTSYQRVYLNLQEDEMENYNFQFYSINSIKKLLSLYQDLKSEIIEINKKYSDSTQIRENELNILKDNFLEKLNYTIETFSEKINNWILQQEINLFDDNIDAIIETLKNILIENNITENQEEQEENNEIEELTFSLIREPILYSSSLKDFQTQKILGPYYAYDWRTALLIYGLQANVNGTDPGPYFGDLEFFWPEEYDLRREKQCFYGEKENNSVYYKTLTSGKFYFDIIDASSSSLGQFSVQNIGRRIDVTINDKINCLFTPEIPNLIFLNTDNPMANWSENTTITELRTVIDITEMLNEQRQECINNGQPYIQVPNEIYDNLIIGGYLNDAYSALRYELFLHTSYQKVASITALPVFHLEPNSRVSLSDPTTNTYGDYIIQNINLTLGPGANLSATLNEALERL